MKKVLCTIWPYLLAIAFWVLVIFMAFDSCDTRKLKKENEQLRYQLAHAQQYVPMELYVIRDTVEVAKHPAQVVERLKPVLTDEEKALLKEVNDKLKYVESMQQTSIETQGSVTLHADTLAPRDGYLSRDSSVLRYQDEWCAFSYNSASRNLDYAVRDSLATIVARRYRHKFLWWKWGVKGYDIQIVNFNPHATVRYDRFVRQK